MALSSIIGRASSPVLPLAIRTVGLGSLISFHGDIATAINVHERTILSPQNSFQCHSYSSAASPSLAKKLLDENLIRIINSEIKTHKLNPVQELPIPKGFRFGINTAADNIFLARDYANESIIVGVTMANLKRSVCGDDNDHLCHSCKIFADKNKKSIGSSFLMTCFIFKDRLKRPAFIGFRFMASADNIAIKSSIIFDGLTKPTDDDIRSDFSGKLKHALLKYLEIRGIKPSTAEYFQKYMINKNREEELQWLMKLRRFIKK